MANPNIITDGQNTRFGSTRRPAVRGHCRQPPWSIKNHVRRLMCYPIRCGSIPSECELLEWLRGPRRTGVTISMLIAAHRVSLAMQDGYEMMKLINYLEGQ